MDMRQIPKWRRRVNSGKYSGGDLADYKFPRGTPDDMKAFAPVWAPLLDGKRKLSIFVRCVHCAEIQDVAGHRIDRDGCIIRDCIHCPVCESYFYARLEGWPGRVELARKLRKERA